MTDEIHHGPFPPGHGAGVPNPFEKRLPPFAVDHLRDSLRRSDRIRVVCDEAEGPWLEVWVGGEHGNAWHWERLLSLTDLQAQDWQSALWRARDVEGT